MDLLTAIFERAPYPSAVVDDGARVLRANEAARTLFGDGEVLYFLFDVELSKLPERSVRVIAKDGRMHSLVMRRESLGEGLHLLSFSERPPGPPPVPTEDAALSAVHDLNNLLTPIAAYASTLAQEASNDRQREMAREIAAAAMRASEVARRAMRGTTRTTSVSLNEVVLGIRTLIEKLLGPGFVLTLSLEPDLALTRVDTLELERAVLNIVSNARDAMGSRGRLTVETANVERPLAEDGHRGSYVMIRLSDTGVGMSESVRMRVLDRPGTNKTDGSGLGLVTVRRVVATAGGFFTIESTEGFGTSIALFFRARPGT